MLDTVHLHRDDLARWEGLGKTARRERRATAQLQQAGIVDGNSLPIWSKSDERGSLPSSAICIMSNRVPFFDSLCSAAVD